MVLLGVILGGIALVVFHNRTKPDPLAAQEIYFLIPLVWFWCVLLVFSPSPIQDLFLKFPAVLLVGLGFSKTLEGLKQKDRALGVLVLGTLVLFISLVSCFFFNFVDSKIRWALPVIPLTIIFIGFQSERIIGSKSMCGVLIGLLFFSMSYGLYNFRNDFLSIKKLNSERIEFLQKHTQGGDIVIFTDRPSMEHAGPLFFERIFVVANQPDEWKKLLVLFKEKAIPHCYFWVPNPAFLEPLNPLLPISHSELFQYEIKAPIGKCGCPPHFYLLKVFLK
jgi:hypothetical protein